MSGIHLELCSEAIAAGDGKEALQFVKVSFACQMFAFSLCVASRSWAAQGGQTANMAAAGTCVATLGGCAPFLFRFGVSSILLECRRGRARHGALQQLQ